MGEWTIIWDTEFSYSSQNSQLGWAVTHRQFSCIKTPNLEYNEEMKCHPGYKTTIKKYYPNDNAIDMLSRFISKASTTLFDTPMDFKNYYRYVWNLGGKKNAVR